MYDLKLGKDVMKRYVSTVGGRGVDMHVSNLEVCTCMLTIQRTNEFD